MKKDKNLCDFTLVWNIKQKSNNSFKNILKDLNMREKKFGDNAYSI